MIDPTTHPLFALPGEDLDLIVHFVLKSGSIKDLAAQFGVSYPTMRARLDRVIARLRSAVNAPAGDELSRLLASFIESGDVSPSAARAIRDVAAKTQGGER